MDKQIIILAAGKGSRMESKIPKVIHNIAGKSMLAHVVDNVSDVTDDKIIVYSSHIEEYLYQFPGCKFAFQDVQLGTAHAASVAMDLVDDQKLVGVIYGDNPFVSGKIINEIFAHLITTNSAIVTLAFIPCDKNHQYGRIILDDNGNFKKIVEHRQATNEEKEVQLCNSGIMVYASGILRKYLHMCLEKDLGADNGEFYLTDIVEVARSFGEKIEYYIPEHSSFLTGVNTKSELMLAEKMLGNLNQK